VVWNIPLESSRRRLQLCFKPHLDQRSIHKVMRPQSCGSLNSRNFGIPIWESHDKMSFGCGSRGEAQSILYGGRWWLLPSPDHGESCESELPVVRLNTKSAQIITNLLFGLCIAVWVIKCLSLFLVPSRSSNTPFYPKVLRAKEHAPTLCPSVIFTSNSHLSPSGAWEHVKW
jgi:hypothetical protein